MTCEFVGDANTKMVRGRATVVPCKNPAAVLMRLRGFDVVIMGKKSVCPDHMDLLLSPETKAAGRDWQIDRFLNEPKLDERLVYQRDHVWTGNSRSGARRRGVFHLASDDDAALARCSSNVVLIDEGITIAALRSEGCGSLICRRCVPQLPTKRRKR